MVSVGDVVSISGSVGDMTKSIYDNDDDHIVDIAANALKLDNKTADDFLQKTDIIDCGTF